MLRCSHAASLRAGFERNLVLRFPPSSPLPRASQQFLPATPLLTVSSPITIRTLIAGTRDYSTIPDDPGLELASDRIPSAASTDARRPLRHRRQNEDPLLEIAISRYPEGQKVSRKVVEMELKWLADPRALADRVGRLLNAGQVALAAEMVRTAQKNQMECAVAWNHLLEFCMKKQSPRAAFKFYNDMKKRGRKPNSRTYTIMLNGLSKVGKYSGLNPVRTALSIYRSIFAPSSGIEPHIIHSNAMLGVCARHGDMDSLWEVAGELPETGSGSPDSFTYTIILKAIKESTQRDLAGFDPHETEKIFNRKGQAVKEGKRVWSDIVYRWKKGELALDNHLVGAMAGVLLEGTGDLHFYEVFALLHQTTGLPILTKEPAPDARGSTSGGKPQKNPLRSNQVEDVPFVDEEGRLYRPSQPEPEIPKEEEEEEEETFEKLFNPIVSDTLPVGNLSAPEDKLSVPSYISLGNRELSMILETCLAMTQALSIGRVYWQYLTQGEHGHQIKPDAGSFHQYLRLLRLGRSSRATVDVFRDQMAPARKADGKAFHIAFSCCRRDRKNINVLKNANELLSIMDTSLILPDPRALEGYLDLIQILEDNPQFLVSLNGLDANKKRASGNLEAVGRRLQLNLQSVAIGHLRPLAAKLNEAMEHGYTTQALAKTHLGGRNNQQKIPGVVALRALTRTRMLVDSVLKLDNEGLLSKSARREFEQESKLLRKYSKPEILEKFKSVLVSPTPDQVLAHQRPEAQASPEDQ